MKYSATFNHTYTSDVVAPIFVVKADELIALNGFAGEDLIELKSWLTRRQVVSWIEPISETYYDAYFKLLNQKRKQMNQLFEVEEKMPKQVIWLSE